MTCRPAFTKRSIFKEEVQATLYSFYVYAFFLVNLVAISASIISGYHRGNVAYRFEEKQTMTYFPPTQKELSPTVESHGGELGEEKRVVGTARESGLDMR